MVQLKIKYMNQKICLGFVGWEPLKNFLSNSNDAIVMLSLSWAEGRIGVGCPGSGSGAVYEGELGLSKDFGRLLALKENTMVEVTTLVGLAAATRVSVEP